MNGEIHDGRELGHQRLLDVESQASPHRTMGSLESWHGWLTACPFKMSITEKGIWRQNLGLLDTSSGTIVPQFKDNYKLEGIFLNPYT